MRNFASPPAWTQLYVLPRKGKAGFPLVPDICASKCQAKVGLSHFPYPACLSPSFCGTFHNIVACILALCLRNDFVITPPSSSLYAVIGQLQLIFWALAYKAPSLSQGQLF